MAELEADLEKQKSLIEGEKAEREEERRREDSDARRREKEQTEALEKAHHQLAARQAAAVERVRKEAERRLSEAQRRAKAREESLRAEYEARIKEAERAQAELERENEELQAKPSVSALKESDLTDLVFGIAHQMRNPMAIVRSLAEGRLDRPAIPAGEKQALEAILRAVKGLGGRLEELIDFTKPMTVRLEAYSPASLLEKIAAEIQARSRTQGVKVLVEAEEGLPEYRLEAERMREALLNVAVNALEAMPQGGTLRLGARRGEAGALMLEAEDTGPGVPPEHHGEIGRPFFSMKQGSAGLGLAIVKRASRGPRRRGFVPSPKGKG